MIGVVFAGPSLPPGSVAAPSWLQWRPPLRQGDLYRAALERPDVIGVVDGYFETVPTVWHKEILWALSQGIAVYGAASIGALRAAELEAFGMRGVGVIFAAFRDGVLTDDDEVALQHGPAELGYVAVTEAMVNVRATLARAVAEGVIGAAEANLVVAAGKALFYKDRTVSAILAIAVKRGLDAARATVLAEWWLEGRMDQKRLDAARMVKAMTWESGASVSSEARSFVIAVTTVWAASTTTLGGPATLLHS